MRDERLEAGQPEGIWRQRAARRPRPAVHPRRDRDHHPRRPGAAARPAAQGPPRRRRRCRRDGLQRARMTSREMFASPRYVLKQGELMVEEGELRRTRRPGAASTSKPGYDEAVVAASCGHASTGIHGAVRPLSRARGCPTGRSGIATDMKIRGVHIEDTFAEAFTMRSARLIITARSARGCGRRALSSPASRPPSSAASARQASSASSPRPRRPMAGRASACC